VPISRYFQGHGDKVYKAMQREYGASKGKQVFYATANKRKQNPVDELKAEMRKTGDYDGKVR